MTGTVTGIVTVAEASIAQSLLDQLLILFDTPAPNSYTAEIGLRQLVPGFYILAGFYLALVPAKLRHSMGFSVIGVIMYIVLNEPEWFWLPVWITYNQWTIIALFSLLGLGIWLFWLTLEHENVDWPWIYAVDAWRWLRERLF